MADSTGGKACIATATDTGNMESLRFYQARRTVIEMLRDRGYLVADMEAELRRSLADFRTEFGDNPEANRLRLVASRASNPDRKILVIFSEAIGIKKQNAVGILNQIVNKETLDRVILILQKNMSSYARRVFAEYPVRVETFLITELLVNVTNDYPKSKFEILTPEEKETLLKTCNINRLSYMVANSEIPRYHGLVAGDVVKVTYFGQVTGPAVVYLRIA